MRGWNQQFAKLPYWLNGTEGSNPSLTAGFNKADKEYTGLVVSGCSAARLAHLLWEQGVPGSNPGTPTLKMKELDKNLTPFLFPV